MVRDLWRMINQSITKTNTDNSGVWVIRFTNSSNNSQD